MKCGKEDTCRAAKFSKADGFLGGKNGGRACAYIAGSFCNPVRHGKPTGDNCRSCDFYRYLKGEHGKGMNILAFSHFIEQRGSIRLPLYEIPS